MPTPSGVREEDTSGRLWNDRGCVTARPGLYVLGQEFQYMFNSHTVGGVGKDAAYVVREIDRRSKSTAAVGRHGVDEFADDSVQPA